MRYPVRSSGLVAALAALPMMVTMAAPASSADFGGDCCADLEERVADLEATTARKGNRRVSLKIYGHVNPGILYWDNGDQSDTYIVDSVASGSRFGFKGGANLSSRSSAGYMIEVGVNWAQAHRVTVNRDDFEGSGLVLRHAHLWVADELLGRLSLGQQAETSDGLFYLDHSSANLVTGDLTGGSLVFGGTNIALSDVFVGLDGGRGNLIRYDSPNIAGFTVSANWGENDFWGVALRYANSFGDFKLKAGIGYDEKSGDDISSTRTESTLLGSGSVLHVPSGVFLAGAYGEMDNDSGDLRDVESWSVKGGFYQRFLPFGMTTLYGEYSEVTQDGSARVGDGDHWGVGLVQGLDSAAMEVYLGYRSYSIDDPANDAAADAEDINMLYTGARIKF